VKITKNLSLFIEMLIFSIQVVIIQEVKEFIINFDIVIF